MFAQVKDFLAGFRRADRVKYASEWLRTVSAGAIILGLLNPEFTGGRMLSAILAVGLPFGVVGFWLAGGGEK